MDSKVCFQRFDRHGVDFVPTVHQYRNQYLSIFDIAIFDHADEGGDDDDDDDGEDEDGDDDDEDDDGDDTVHCNGDVQAYKELGLLMVLVSVCVLTFSR